MKVLHLSSASDWRGGENQLVLLASHLPPGIESIIAAPRGSEVLSRSESAFDTREVPCRGALDIGSIVKIRRILTKERIDVVHAHSSKAHEVALLARLFTGIPLVVSRRVAFPVAGGWKYRAADRLIAVSAAASIELHKAGVAADRLVIIHDAVDPVALRNASAERAGASDADIVVLCAAALSQEKDHQLLLDAWRIVEDSTAKGRLHLAGDGPLREAIAAGIVERGLSRVHLLGWRDDVPGLVKGADMVTLSSRDEGFASVLCQGQMAGKPVVATRAGGIPEAVLEGVTGLLSEISDAPAFARNLLMLIEDEDLRRRLGSEGQRHADASFDAGQIARRHADVYASLLEKRR